MIYIVNGSQKIQILEEERYDEINNLLYFQSITKNPDIDNYNASKIGYKVKKENIFRNEIFAIEKYIENLKTEKIEILKRTEELEALIKKAIEKKHCIQEK